jgi:hypothetical protein
LMSFMWCGRRESNPHSLLGKQILSLLRLPVSPRPRMSRLGSDGQIICFYNQELKTFISIDFAIGCAIPVSRVIMHEFRTALP